MVPVPWDYLVATSGGCLLLSGPSAHRRPGDDRHGGRTEEGTNQLAWQADEDTILGWADTEGYPVDGAIGPEGQYSKADIPEHTQYDTQSLAKFAFSMKQKKKSDVAVLLGYAGSHKGLTFLGLGLSAVSMLLSMTPYICI